MDKQKHPQEVFCKKCIHKYFANFTRKHLCSSLLMAVSGYWCISNYTRIFLDDIFHSYLQLYRLDFKVLFLHWIEKNYLSDVVTLSTSLLIAFSHFLLSSTTDITFILSDTAFYVLLFLFNATV